MSLVSATADSLYNRQSAPFWHSCIDVFVSLICFLEYFDPISHLPVSRIEERKYDHVHFSINSFNLSQKWGSARQAYLTVLSLSRDTVFGSRTR